ncbi:MAG: M15 family metallopeptidase [Coriobacteriales bacterium]|jgi:LAS superfamily LD-carboxypeptidase LdcB
MFKRTTLRGLAILFSAALCIALLGACSNQEQAPGGDVQADAAAADAEQGGIDYMALVNKTHELPAGWEDAVEIVSFENSEGWNVDVEAKAYDAYLAMKAELEEEGVYVDLDSAYRSVEEQQEIVDNFTEKYGPEYVKQYVAVPGYSEHHTGLALDLFLIIDGKGVVENEDMVTYPEVWDKIHAKLADHGFILRYLPEKKIETGYSYEPWHIRYIDNPDVAKEIMKKGITLERYLGELDPAIADCAVDYGTSKIYEEADIDSAIDPILSEFTSWEGCTLKSLSFAGDDACNPEEVNYANELREAQMPDEPEFDQVIVFTSTFHSPSAEQAEGTAWEPDTDYVDWNWHLARTGDDGEWKLLTWGY